MAVLPAKKMQYEINEINDIILTKSKTLSLIEIFEKLKENATSNLSMSDFLKIFFIICI